MYDIFYERIDQKSKITKDIKGAIIPHHLLAGHLDAAFFEAIKKQNPANIVLFSPNHFSRGTKNIVSTELDWKTIYGEVETNSEIIKKLSKKNIVEINEEVIKEEHGIYSLIPFIARSLPDTKVLVFGFKGGVSEEEQEVFLEEIDGLLPNDTVFVSSIDFSHYQNNPIANFHDELSINVIKNFDYSRLSKLEIDSVPSLFALLKVMEKNETQEVSYEVSTNAAKLTASLNSDDITSYYSAYFSSGDSLESGVASMLFFGDLMLDREVKEKAKQYGSDYLLEKLAGEEDRFFMGMDIINANLEGPFVYEDKKEKGHYTFSFDDYFIPFLKKYNFSLFSQANNHSYNMGSAGFEESKKILKDAGFGFYGKQFGVDNESVLIEEIGGQKLAFLGFNDTNSPIDFNKAVDLIKQTEKEADFTILNIHWGEEYKKVSNERQKYLAREFIDAGVDTIIGHHPHVVQEIEIYKNKPIFYSLGNFIFDQYWSVPTQQGLAVGLVVKYGKISVYTFPIKSVDMQTQLMSANEADIFMTNILKNSRLLDNNFSNFNLIINL